jgi:hypothetical protein
MPRKTKARITNRTTTNQDKRTGVGGVVVFARGRSPPSESAQNA